MVSGLPACARDFSVHFTLVIRVREQQTPYRYLGERRACGGDFASRAHCVPGLERVDRLHPRSLDAVSPWVLGFQHTVAMFINLAVGLSIAYLALLDLWLTHYGPSPEKA